MPTQSETILLAYQNYSPLKYAIKRAVQTKLTLLTRRSLVLGFFLLLPKRPWPPSPEGIHYGCGGNKGSKDRALLRKSLRCQAWVVSILIARTGYPSSFQSDSKSFKGH